MASLMSKRPTKKHDEFTLEEDNAIVKGVHICSGQNKWSHIKLMFPVELANRNRTQIRCRWNVLQSKNASQAIATASASTNPAGSLSPYTSPHPQQLPTCQTLPVSQFAHLQPAQVQTQPQPATALVPHLQQAQVQGQTINQVQLPRATQPQPTTAQVHVPTNQVTTGFTWAVQKATPIALTSRARVTFQRQNEVQVQRAPFPASSPTATAPTFTTAQYLQLMTTIPNHITNPNSNVIEVLTHLLDDNDSPNHYTSVFGQYIATCRATNFILYTTAKIRDIKAKRPVLELQRLMSLFEELDSSMSAINGMLCGKLRSCVLNFEVNDNDCEEGGASGWSSTFRVRKSYKEHTLAFGRLLVYLDHFKCQILLKYKIQVSGDGYSQERCLEQGLIAKLIFELAMETVQDGDTLPIICCFALFDCFHIKNGNLKLKALNCMSKIFSSILYLMREGVVACASMMVNNNQAELAVSMIKSSKDQAATN